MYLLIDIGGTKTRLALSTDGAKLGPLKIVPTQPDFKDSINTISRLAHDLTGQTSIKAVAAGMPGPLDSAKTMSIGSPNLPNWKNQPLKQELERTLQVPVYIENDADLAGLGEATAGAGQNHRIVVYLTISTGVGGTRIVNRRIDENAFGFEPGHQIIVSESGAKCNCGGHGHLEAYVSGTAIRRHYGKKAEDITDPAVWDQTARWLAYGLNNVTVHWSPHCIVLGGSVMRDIPLPALRQYFKQTAVIFPQLPRVERAALGETAGLEGALAYLQQHAHN